jgi:hypothetical protein
MKRTQLAIAVIGVAITLAAESPICRRIVFHTVHRRHSKAVLSSWAEWNKMHGPPKPKDILAELDLACPPIDLANTAANDFVPLNPWPVWNQPEMEPDDFVAANPSPTLNQPEIGSNERHILQSLGVLEAQEAPILTFYVGPPAPTPVPEPTTVALVGSGLLALLAKRQRRLKWLARLPLSGLFVRC